MKISNDNLFYISKLKIKGEKNISYFFDLEIKKNTTYQIYGENGSGKSLLIEYIIGLRFSSKIKRMKNIKIGYMPQEYIDGMQVKNIIKQFSFIVGSKYGESLMAALSIDILKERSYNDISSGEKQRVKLALALLREPDILILDELSNGMDVAILKDILGLILKLRKRYLFSIIFIDHNDIVNKYLEPQIIEMGKKGKSNV